jgi:hypothetical protein
VRIPEGSLSREDFLQDQGVQSRKQWTSLREALELGAIRINEKMFVAPYLAGENDLQSGEMVAGHNVLLRDTPSQKGHVVRVLDYHPVQLIADHSTDIESRSIDSPTAWAHIRTDSGATGYVFVGLLRAATGPRFYFELVEGSWKLTAYGDGD